MKFNQCPNCHEKPREDELFGGSGHFSIYKCKKCKTRYCHECGGYRCPECGSEEILRVGECWGK